jgi:hypothetical protein
MEQRRTIVAEIQPTAGSERQACRWLGFHRSAVRYPATRPADAALRGRLRELAAAHPRWSGAGRCPTRGPLRSRGARAGTG